VFYLLVTTALEAVQTGRVFPIGFPQRQQQRPGEAKLSREDGEALMERVKANALTPDDQRVLVKLIELYFWLTVVLRETKISLKRLKSAAS
jgi:hypothetical protein